MTLLRNTFFRYCLVGLFNSAAGLLLIYLFLILNFGNSLANLFGYIGGLIISFSLNKKFTFKGDGNILKFLIVIIFSYLSNLAIVMISIEVFDIQNYVAQAIGIPVYTLLSYLGCKYFAFTDHVKIKNLIK